MFRVGGAAYRSYYESMYYDSMIHHWMDYVSMYNNAYYNASFRGNSMFRMDTNASIDMWSFTADDIAALCRMLRDHGYF